MRFWSRRGRPDERPGPLGSRLLPPATRGLTVSGSGLRYVLKQTSGTSCVFLSASLSLGCECGPRPAAEEEPSRGRAGGRAAGAPREGAGPSAARRGRRRGGGGLCGHSRPPAPRTGRAGAPRRPRRPLPTLRGARRGILGIHLCPGASGPVHLSVGRGSGCSVGGLGSGREDEHASKGGGFESFFFFLRPGKRGGA